MFSFCLGPTITELMLTIRVSDHDSALVTNATWGQVSRGYFYLFFHLLIHAFIHSLIHYFFRYSFTQHYSFEGFLCAHSFHACPI